MATTEPVKPTKAPRPSPSWRRKHGPDAYVAQVASLAEIWQVVQGGAGPDAAVAWVADRQLGLITTPQLHTAGVRRGSLEWRLETGALHRRYRGVYLVGHRLAVPGADELAAVLACGEGAFVSHRSAAALWGLGRAPVGEVDVVVVERNCRSREGIRVQRVQRMFDTDRSSRRGIPVTSAARTVIDFAASTGRDQAERAIAEACALKLTNEPQILAAVDRGPNRAGVAQVRAILGQPGGPKRTRSDGERAMLRLVRAARLPAPLTNAPLLGFNADFLWPAERVIVEVDGYDVHSHRAAFERDHRRDIVHKNAGYEVLRFTARQIEDEPLYVAAVIARALERRTRG